jgi:hypothetical protein
MARGPVPRSTIRRTNLSYFGLLIPEEAPGLLGLVGPVEVPADPPALLLPKPAFGLTPDVAPGVAVGDPTGPPLGVGTDVAGALAPCCPDAAVPVPASNSAESTMWYFLFMILPFRFVLRDKRCQHCWGSWKGDCPDLGWGLIDESETASFARPIPRGETSAPKPKIMSCVNLLVGKRFTYGDARHFSRHRRCVELQADTEPA